MPYQDGLGRAINYLRVSVTDRCNLRCVYCMPEEGIEKRRHDEMLSYEEFEVVVRAAVGLGISKVRLTGGEPLARLGLPDFVARIAGMPGIDDLSMTTNGTLLARHAADLAAAGLHRVNISLDTLRADRFAMITRRGRLEDVMEGMAAARRAGLEPIKLNVVVIGGINDDELGDFARRTVSDGWHVRFIELMPIGANADWARERIVPLPEVRARIESEWGPLQAVHGPRGNGPARYYQAPGAQGSLGFIGALSDHFCPTCNRLRLTADGRLRPCLMDEREIDLLEPLRSGADIDTIKDLLIQAIHSKPQHHHLEEALSPHDRDMSQIGG